MVSPTDPIRVVDRRDLRAPSINVEEIARLVREDLVALRRAQQDRLRAEFEGLDERHRRAIFGDRPPQLRPIRVPKESYVAGYVSNVRAWLFNESRRAKETVVDLTTGNLERAVFRRWAAAYGGNENVFNLSLSTHARATARAAVWEYTIENEIDFLALVIPPVAEDRIRPGGVLARFVGRIFAPGEWQKRAREVQEQQRRRSLSVVFSMGFHHGDPHQMVPVFKYELEAALAVLRQYRRRFFRRGS